MKCACEVTCYQTTNEHGKLPNEVWKHFKGEAADVHPKARHVQAHIKNHLK